MNADGWWTVGRMLAGLILGFVVGYFWGRGRVGEGK